MNGLDLIGMILPKGSTYSWRCVEPGECLLIEFDAPQEMENIISVTVADSNFFENAFLNIQRKLRAETPESRFACRQALYGLLRQLAKALERKCQPKDKKELLKELLRPALKYIAERYDDPRINNDRLAGLCGISTVYFRKCFERAYGVPPIRYLHDFRISRAKEILASDYGSVSQVAESVGYSNVYHFSKMFKHYTGLAPTEYAKASRN